MVVQATSGTGDRELTATQTITVTVTDDDTEAPAAPDAPSVSPASVTSLNVNWSAPDNAGPAITDYDVQYRAGTSGPWSDGSHIGTALTAILTGLEEDTSYQVQVRATNDEGTGGWSASGSDATDANAAPSFTSNATFNPAENQTAVGTVAASDGDTGDEVTGYALSGGADRALFSINDSGVLTFQAAPDYEDPQDANTDNAHVVVVQATSGTGDREKTGTQTITVTVMDDDAVDGRRGRLDDHGAVAGRRGRLDGHDGAAGRRGRLDGHDGAAGRRGRLDGHGGVDGRRGRAGRRVQRRRTAADGLRGRRRADRLGLRAGPRDGPRRHPLVLEPRVAVALLRPRGRAVAGRRRADDDVRGRLCEGAAGDGPVAVAQPGPGRVHRGRRRPGGVVGDGPVPVGYKATERVTVWGVAGYGTGGLLLTPRGGPALESGLSMAMAAAGTRGELVSGGAGGFALAFKTDALWVGTSIAGVDGPAGRLKATDTAVTRIRTGLAGSRAYTLGGRLSLKPSVEVGLRHDGGDAETGAGMDVGGGLVVSDSSTGLAVDLRVRMLVMHQAEGFRERGMAVSLSYNPRPSTPLGLVARVAPSWGGQATSGAEALWGRETMGGMSPGGVASGNRLDGEVGYGLPVGSRFVGTPRVGFSTSEYGRDYRAGYGLGLLNRGSLSLELGIDAQRRESPLQGAASNGVLGRATLGW